MVVSQNEGTFFGGPYNKDYCMLRPILGSPYLRKPPFQSQTKWIYNQCSRIFGRAVGLRHSEVNPKPHKPYTLTAPSAVPPAAAKPGWRKGLPPERNADLLSLSTWDMGVYSP